MAKIKAVFKRLVNDERGGTAVEYGLITFLIALKDKIRAIFKRVRKANRSDT